MPDNNVKSLATETFKADLKRLISAKSVSDGDFADVIYRTLTAHGITVDALRDTFGITKDAADRWMNMQNLPQPNVRGKIIQWIFDQIS